MKANTKTGLLIEPHFLERNKFSREVPIINDGIGRNQPMASKRPNVVRFQTMFTGSYNTIHTELEPNSIFSLTGSSVITTNNLKRIGPKYCEATVGFLEIGCYEVDNPYSTTPISEEQGTNTTINISTSEPDRIILNEIPNTTFNTQFCQAPIQPYTGTEPENYKAYSSNVILGNATKAGRSSIYYSLTDRGKQTAY